MEAVFKVFPFEKSKIKHLMFTYYQSACNLKYNIYFEMIMVKNFYIVYVYEEHLSKNKSNWTLIDFAI